MVDGPPEVMREVVDLHLDLVEVPAPVGQDAHAVDSLATDLRCEHRAKPVPPEPHALEADVDAALMQQVRPWQQPERKALDLVALSGDHSCRRRSIGNVC